MVIPNFIDYVGNILGKKVVNVTLNRRDNVSMFITCVKTSELMHRFSIVRGVSAS